MTKSIVALSILSVFTLTACGGGSDNASKPAPEPEPYAISIECPEVVGSNKLATCSVDNAAQEYKFEFGWGDEMVHHYSENKTDSKLTFSIKDVGQINVKVTDIETQKSANAIIIAESPIELICPEKISANTTLDCTVEGFKRGMSVTFQQGDKVTISELKYKTYGADVNFSPSSTNSDVIADLTVDGEKISSKQVRIDFPYRNINFTASRPLPKAVLDPNEPFEKKFAFMPTANPQFNLKITDIDSEQIFHHLSYTDNKFEDSTRIKGVATYQISTEHSALYLSPFGSGNVAESENVTLDSTFNNQAIFYHPHTYSFKLTNLMYVKHDGSKVEVAGSNADYHKQIDYRVIDLNEYNSIEGTYQSSTLDHDFSIALEENQAYGLFFVSTSQELKVTNAAIEYCFKDCPESVEFNQLQSVIKADTDLGPSNYEIVGEITEGLAPFEVRLDKNGSPSMKILEKEGKYYLMCNTFFWNVMDVTGQIVDSVGNSKAFSFRIEGHT